MEQWEYKQTFIAIHPPTGRDMNEFIPTPPGEKVNLEKSELWEYLIEEELQKYGDEGWELVTISESLSHGESLDGFAVFKRRKNETENALALEEAKLRIRIHNNDVCAAYADLCNKMLGKTEIHQDWKDVIRYLESFMTARLMQEYNWIETEEGTWRQLTDEEIYHWFPSEEKKGKKHAHVDEEA